MSMQLQSPTVRLGFADRSPRAATSEDNLSRFCPDMPRASDVMPGSRVRIFARCVRLLHSRLCSLQHGTTMSEVCVLARTNSAVTCIEKPDRLSDRIRLRVTFQMHILRLT